MAGRGPAPKPPELRRNAAMKLRGEWQSLPGVGWQHGDLPGPPPRLTRSARNAWDTWMHAWFAAHWHPEDVPVLRQIIRLFDSVERGTATSTERSELRQLMDSYGITPKGQQDRRWQPPKPEQEKPAETAQAAAGSRYAHLKVVNE